MLVSDGKRNLQDQGKKSVDPNQIYLHNCSTSMQIVNPNLLTNVYQVNTCLYGHCNAGTSSTNRKGVYGKIDCWLNQQGIANIISISVFKKLKYDIKYDRNDNFWIVYNYGVTVILLEDDQGLPYNDVSEHRVVFAQTLPQFYGELYQVLD